MLFWTSPKQINKTDFLDSVMVLLLKGWHDVYVFFFYRLAKLVVSKIKLKRHVLNWIHEYNDEMQYIDNGK